MHFLLHFYGVIFFGTPNIGSKENLGFLMDFEYAIGGFNCVHIQYATLNLCNRNKAGYTAKDAPSMGTFHL